MDERVDRHAVVSIELTNDILDPSRDRGSQGLAAISAQDASEVLISFQHLVYMTVLVSAGDGRTAIRQLTNAERSQYALVLQDIQIGSLRADFGVQETVKDLGDSAKRVIAATVHWSSELAHQLGSDERIGAAADMAPDVLDIVAGAVLPVIVIVAGPSASLDAATAIAVVRVLAAFLRISRKTNRQHSISHGGNEWRPTKAEVDAVLGAQDALSVLRDDQFKFETRPFVRSRGTVTGTRPGRHTLDIKFPAYDELVPCQYTPTESLELGHLQAGDTLEVEGMAMHIPGAPPDAPPRLVKIVDWGGLQRHHFPGQYKP